MPGEVHTPYLKANRLWRRLGQDTDTAWFVRCDEDAHINMTLMSELLARYDPDREWRVRPSLGWPYAGRIRTHVPKYACVHVSGAAAILAAGHGVRWALPERPG